MGLDDKAKPKKKKLSPLAVRSEVAELLLKGADRLEGLKVRDLLPSDDVEDMLDLAEGMRIMAYELGR